MIIGIDPGSKKTGLCFFDEKKKKIVKTILIETNEKLCIRKIFDLTSRVEHAINEHGKGINGIVIEKMFMNNKGAAILIVVQQILREIASQYAPVVEYAPMSWKQFMGSAKMSKIESYELLKKRFGSKYFLNAKGKLNEDISDATALAICGAANDMRPKIPKTVFKETFITYFS